MLQTQIFDPDEFSSLSPLPSSPSSSLFLILDDKLLCLDLFGFIQI